MNFCSLKESRSSIDLYQVKLETISQRLSFLQGLEVVECECSFTRQGLFKTSLQFLELGSEQGVGTTLSLDLLC